METFKIKKELIDRLFHEFIIFSGKFFPMKTIKITSDLQEYIKNPKVNLFVNFVRQGNNPEINGYYRSTNLKTKTILIVVPKDFKDPVVVMENEEEIRRVIKHEIIHALDEITSETRLGKAKGAVDTKEYYEIDTEFNAFYHEVLDLLEKYPKEVVKLKTNRDLERFILKSIGFVGKDFSFIVPKIIERLKKEGTVPNLQESFRDKVNYYIKLNKKALFREPRS
jgi:hypothetical protein